MAPEHQTGQRYADRDAVDAAASRCAWHMTHLEETLGRGGGPWICGAAYSLADICVAPILDRVESLDLETLWDGLPAVAAWYARMKERPAFRRAMPPFEYRMWGPRKPVPAGGVDPDEAGDRFPAG